MPTPRPPTLWTTDLAQQEDGQRVEVTEDSFEWWYFDTILDDGSTCVVTFFSKVPFVPGPPSPILQLNISPPQGPYQQQQVFLPPASYSASPTHCAVTMGTSWVTGDLRSYELYAEADGLAAHLVLRDIVPGWRTGPFVPPEQAAQQPLAEQVVIPSGVAEGTLMYDGRLHRVTGSCYHDHQWGSARAWAAGAAGARVTSWYWGRARAGDHAIVFAQVLGAVGDGPSVPIAVLFMLARGTRMTFDDDVTALRVTPLDGGIDHGVIVEWTSNLGGVVLTLPSPKQIASLNNGEYQRFLSPAVLHSDYAGENVSSQGQAIWEINVFP